MKRFFSTSCIILLIFFVSACQSRSGAGTIQQTPLHVGQEGISLSFLANLPPNKFYAPEEGEEVEFEVGIDIANKGAYAITSGYLAIGLERDYVQFGKWNLEDQSRFSQIDIAGQRLLFNLLGKSPIDPLGERATVTASLTPLPLDRLTEQHMTTILVTACYPYATEASAQVCIDADVYNTKPIEKVCSPATVTLSGGQGAPVAVTQVEERILSSGGGEYIRPQFIIHIKNVGRGTIVRQDKVETACSAESISPEARAQFFNSVYLEELRFSEFSLSQGHFECVPVEMKLKDGEGFVKCTLQAALLSAQRETYATPLFVRLRYGYFQTIAKDVLLERLLPY